MPSLNSFWNLICVTWICNVDKINLFLLFRRNIWTKLIYMFKNLCCRFFLHMQTTVRSLFKCSFVTNGYISWRTNAPLCIVYFVVNGKTASFTWHSFVGICWQSAAFSHAGLLFSVVSDHRADFFPISRRDRCIFDPSYKTAPPRFVLCNMTSLKWNAVRLCQTEFSLTRTLLNFLWCTLITIGRGGCNVYRV